MLDKPATSLVHSLLDDRMETSRYGSGGASPVYPDAPRSERTRRKLFLHELDQAVDELNMTEDVVRSHDAEFRRALALLNRRVSLSSREGPRDIQTVPADETEHADPRINFKELHEEVQNTFSEFRGVIEHMRESLASIASDVDDIRMNASPSTAPGPREASNVWIRNVEREQNTQPYPLRDSAADSVKDDASRTRIEAEECRLESDGLRRRPLLGWPVIACLFLVVILTISTAILWYIVDDFMYKLI